MSVLLNTERLILKSVIIDNATEIFNYRSLEEVYKYQGFRPEKKEDVIEFINKNVVDEINIPDTWIQLCIFIKESNNLIGDIGVHFIDDKQVEIGYTLSPEFQGKGYAIEAIKEVINYIFKILKKHRITASVDPENMRSINLLEKIGMRKEAHMIKSVWFNEKWADDVIFAMLEEEYNNKGEN
ncbi:GNAT family protein [Clostridiaceae bacterium HSG29]|nr:GNAT family protein [Clostridiaceae bacterium HSG29]